MIKLSAVLNLPAQKPPEAVGYIQLIPRRYCIIDIRIYTGKKFIGDVKMKNITILLTEEPTVLIGGTSDADKSSEVQTTAQAAQAAPNSSSASAAATGGGFGIIGMILYIVALVALFYFFAVRPQKKREKEMKEMQASIEVGDEIMTSSGFYGRVAEVDDASMIVEFGINRGVKIKVKKSEIIKVTANAESEK